MFRLGRLLGVKGPGLVLLIPGVDRMVRVDLRTVTLDIPPQNLITRDNVPAKRQRRLLLPRRRRRPRRRERRALPAATSQIAQTTLRSVLGKADLDMLLGEREQLNEALQHIIDEHTDPWGIKVTTVEIKDVEIPTAMQHAMALGAQAERERRAKIIHAEGEYQASAAPARRRRRDLRQPRLAAAALPADADRDRRHAELDGRVPAPDGRDQAVRRGASAVRRARPSTGRARTRRSRARSSPTLTRPSPDDSQRPVVASGRSVGPGRRRTSSPPGLSSKPRRPRAGGKS